MKTKRLRMLGILLCLAVSGVASAQDASPIRITNSVFQEIEVKAADGTTSTKLVPAEKVIPGGEVVYRIDVANSGDAVATDIAINNAVPAEMVLSSEPNPAPSVVSVDGGETFGALTGLSVVGADGASRDAQLTDITNLRWVIATLAPGAKTQVVYRARLK